MSNLQRLGASFRDPSGYVFRKDGVHYRLVHPRYKDEYDLLMSSGLHHQLSESGEIVSHEDVSGEFDLEEPVYKILKPIQIPFISYPYEWCFGQLKDAALLTLALQEKALRSDLSLKDASAYNIQFLEGKPILIDSLSFERYREGEPWVAYQQFCRHFLGPLALMSYGDVRLSKLLQTYIEGIPLDLVSRLLPFRTRLNLSLQSHIHLHANLQRRFASSDTGKEIVERRKFKKSDLLSIIQDLKHIITKLEWRTNGTTWQDYYSFHTYESEAFESKRRLVGEYLAATASEKVWDLGANIGAFSRIASSRDVFTVAMDSDPGAVQANYHQCKVEEEKNILPLLIDLTNPSANIGWANQERKSLIDRGPADTLLVLAFVHHMAISNNVPLIDLASFLSRLGRWLIIEFVPKQDQQVQILLKRREDIFDDYHPSAFEGAFSTYYIIHRSEEIERSSRVLYLMERRTDA